jgi:hypothetical protein
LNFSSKGTIVWKNEGFEAVIKPDDGATGQVTVDLKAPPEYVGFGIGITWGKKHEPVRLEESDTGAASGRLTIPKSEYPLEDSASKTLLIHGLTAPVATAEDRKAE